MLAIHSFYLAFSLLAASQLSLVGALPSDARDCVVEPYTAPMFDEVRSNTLLIPFTHLALC